MPISRNCTRCGRSFIEYSDTVECPICETIIEKSLTINTINEGDDAKMRRKKKKKSVQVTAQGVPVTKPIVIYSNREESWEVKLDEIKTCGKAPEDIIVWFEPIVKAKIDALMDEYTNIEWLAYLVGKLDMNDLDNIIIDDLVIPKQEITSTSVDEVECDEFNNLGIVGVIHSHHGMGNTFSGTDHQWINQNHKISLCVAKSGIAGHLRWKTPCGALMTIKAKCKLRYDVDFDKDNFIEDAKGRIKKKSYSYTYPDNQYQGGFHAGYVPPYQAGPNQWKKNAGLNKSQEAYVGSGSVKEENTTPAETTEKSKEETTTTVVNTELSNEEVWESGAETASDDSPTDVEVEFNHEEEESLVEALTRYEQRVIEAGV